MLALPSVVPVLDRWSKLTAPEDVDALMLALNPRGIRESDLLIALKERAEAIRSNLIESQRRKQPRRRQKACLFGIRVV